MRYLPWQRNAILASRWRYLRRYYCCCCFHFFLHYWNFVIIWKKTKDKVIYSPLLPWSKLFVHLLSLITEHLNEINRKNLWDSKTRSKNLSDATNLVPVALTVQKWEHFESDILFLKMQKKTDRFYSHFKVPW